MVDLLQSYKNYIKYPTSQAEFNYTYKLILWNWDKSNFYTFYANNYLIILCFWVNVDIYNTQ